MAIPAPKILNHTLHEFVPECKINIYSIFSFLRYSQFRVHRPDQIGHTHFWKSRTKKFPINSQLLWIHINMRLIHITKNEAISSICSGEIVEWKILQFDWLRACWPIFQEQGFPQYRICWNTAKNINFHYRTNSVKINKQGFF